MNLRPTLAEFNSCFLFKGGIVNYDMMPRRIVHKQNASARLHKTGLEWFR